MESIFDSVQLALDLNQASYSRRSRFWKQRPASMVTQSSSSAKGGKRMNDKRGDNLVTPTILQLNMIFAVPGTRMERKISRIGIPGSLWKTPFGNALDFVDSRPPLFLILLGNVFGVAAPYWIYKTPSSKFFTKLFINSVRSQAAPPCWSRWGTRWCHEGRRQHPSLSEDGVIFSSHTSEQWYIYFVSHTQTIFCLPMSVVSKPWCDTW